MSATAPSNRKRSLDELLAEIKEQPLHVSNVGSAIAGSGSGDFHQYRLQRRAEQARVGKMRAEQEEERKQAEFMNKREMNLIEAEQRTEKLAEKRKRKKEKKKKNKEEKEEETSI
jgi:hypothetical protein